MRWRALYESAKLVYGHGQRIWNNVDAGERQRIGDLLRKSKGRRANLSEREREELFALVKKAIRP
jgi:hypothetical protein